MESPFKCTECGATFENKASLGNHTRNHKSFSCPEASCEYVAKRKDQLKVHITSKHPGSEYAAEEKPRKRKSDEASGSEPTYAQSPATLELGSLLAPTEEGASSSKRPKAEHTEVIWDNNVGNSFSFDTSLLSLLQGASDIHPTEQPHVSSDLTVHSHLPAIRSTGSTPQSAFLVVKPSDMLAPLQLDKENVRLDGHVAPAKEKSTRSLVDQIETLGNQINVLTDLRNRLISELTSKVLPIDDH